MIRGQDLLSVAFTAESTCSWEPHFCDLPIGLGPGPLLEEIKMTMTMGYVNYFKILKSLAQWNPFFYVIKKRPWSKSEAGDKL